MVIFMNKLTKYNSKRNFNKTKEPIGKLSKKVKINILHPTSFSKKRPL